MPALHHDQPTHAPGRRRFRHGQHLRFSTDRNYPLANLFVSMLQRFGIETDKFASATGTMRGLELS